MIIATHLPRAPLNQFIELLWFHEGLNSPHQLERVLPEGSVELIINLRDQDRHIFHPVNYQPQQSYRRSWLSGPHSKFIVIDTAPNASMIGVHFKPGGANAFFSMPLSELRNNVVALDVFWNGAAVSLRDQLLEAPTPTDKFRILEDALLAAPTRSGINSPCSPVCARSFHSPTPNRERRRHYRQAKSESTTLHRTLQRSGWDDAKSILPGAPVPARSLRD